MMTKYEEYKKQLREQTQRMLGDDLERLKNLEKPHDVRFAYKVPTNADRIRAMSDEELARHLHCIGWDCHLCAEHIRLDNEPLLHDKKCDENCFEHCLEWLKQPVGVE